MLVVEEELIFRFRALGETYTLASLECRIEMGANKYTAVFVSNRVRGLSSLLSAGTSVGSLAMIRMTDKEQVSCKSASHVSNKNPRPLAKSIATREAADTSKLSRPGATDRCWLQRGIFPLSNYEIWLI